MRPDIDLRAYLDTRGAKILLLLTLPILVAFALLGGLIQPALMEPAVSDVELTFFVLTLPLSLIIPVVTVMIIAGEWSDSSVQNTFLQRPGRLAVLGSKTIAALVMFVALVGVSIGLAAGATWIGGELIGEGTVFSSFEGLLTTHLAMLIAVFLFSLAVAVLLQSTVIGLVIAIGVPFVVTTAAGLTMAFGSDLAADLVRAVDLQTAAVLAADGEATAFELIPLMLLVVVPLVLGARRWNLREVN